MIFSCHSIASIIFDVLEARALSSRRKARRLASAITFSVLETLVAEVGVGSYFFSTSNGSFLSEGPPNAVIILASSFIHSRERGVGGDEFGAFFLVKRERPRELIYIQLDAVGED